MSYSLSRKYFQEGSEIYIDLEICCGKRALDLCNREHDKFDRSGIVFFFVSFNAEKCPIDRLNDSI